MNTATGHGVDGPTGHTEVVLSIHQRPAQTIVRLHGYVDVVTAPALRESLLGAIHHGMSLLVLDLAGVSFCDASGLAVLIGTQRRAGLAGVTLRLAAPIPQVAKLLHITGLDRTLRIYPTLADALP